MNKNPPSNCCGAPMKINTGEEGTSCYICSKCEKPCDPMANKMDASEKAEEHKCGKDNCEEINVEGVGKLGVTFARPEGKCTEREEEKCKVCGNHPDLNCSICGKKAEILVSPHQAEEWAKEFYKRFHADYAEWGRTETTEEAIDYIRSLLLQAKEEAAREIVEIIEKQKNCRILVPKDGTTIESHKRSNAASHYYQKSLRDVLKVLQKFIHKEETK